MQYSQLVLKGNDLYLSNLERSAKLITKKADAFKSVLIDRQMPFRDTRSSNDIENDTIGRVKEFNFISSIIFKSNYGQIGQLEKILNDNNIMLYFLKHSPKIIKEARTIIQPNFQDIYYITKKIYNAESNALSTLYLREETRNYRDYIIYLMKQIIELLKRNRGEILDGESVDSKIDEMEDFIDGLSYSSNPESFIRTNTGMSIAEFTSELIEQMSDNDEDEEINDLVNQMSDYLDDDYENEELNGDEEIEINQPEQNIISEPEQYEWEEAKADTPNTENKPPPPPPRMNQPPPPPPKVNQPKDIVEEDEYLREQLKKDREEMINTRNQNQPQQQDILSQILNKRQDMNRQNNKSIEENKQINEEEESKRNLTFAQMLKDGKEKINKKSADKPSFDDRVREIENKKPVQMSALEIKMEEIRKKIKDDSDEEDDDDDDNDDWLSGAGFGYKKINSLTYQELRSILSVLGLPNSRGLKKIQLQKILKGYKNKK